MSNGIDHRRVGGSDYVDRPGSQRGQSFGAARRVPFRLEAYTLVFQEAEGFGERKAWDETSVVQIADDHIGVGGANRTSTCMQEDHRQYGLSDPAQTAVHAHLFF